MGDIQDDIENKAEEVKDGGDQHLGDAMDDADFEPDDAGTAPVTDDGELEAVGRGGPPEAGRPTHDEAEIKTDGGA
jgi:hypothetical protein